MKLKPKINGGNIMKTTKLDDIYWSIDDGKDEFIYDMLRIGEELVDIYSDVSDKLFEKFGIIL